MYIVTRTNLLSHIHTYYSFKLFQSLLYVVDIITFWLINEETAIFKMHSVLKNAGWLFLTKNVLSKLLPQCVEQSLINQLCYICKPCNMCNNNIHQLMLISQYLSCQ